MRKLSPLQNQLRSRMEDQGISAHALEKRAGLRPSAVQNILQGKSKRPTALLLQAIARELNCSISDLLGEESTLSPTDVLPEQEMQKTSIDWNSKLYIEAITIVEELLSQKKVETTKETILKYADEVYRYSVRSRGELDKYFAAWLIDHYLIPVKKN